MWSALPQLLLVSGIAIVVALPMTGLRAKGSSLRLLWGALLLSAVGGTLLYVNSHFRTGDHTALTHAEMLPGRRVEGGYVTSEACRKCHQAQFESWHHSFHSTMTQKVSPQTVVAPFDDVVLHAEGRDYRLSRRGDEFWVNMPDPKWYVDKASGDVTRTDSLPAEPPQVDRRVVMSTGSHHMQLYWVTDPTTRQILSVPFVYIFEDQRWVPRNSVFMAGPNYHGDSVTIRVWNEGCINCHAVAGQPRLRQVEGRHDTRVAELGIACEACHGPGDEHVRVRTLALQNPSTPPTPGTSQTNTTIESTADAAPVAPRDPTIVNPANCDPKTSAQICGRCHAVNHIRDEAVWNEGAGDTFRPGTDLTEVRVAMRDPRRVLRERGMDASEAKLPPTFPHFFWPDGLARVSGREYNGLLESPCFRRGDLACVSCHSLHESNPNDQLAAGMEGNQACYQCHADYQAKLTEHTHHAADSEGSRCYNCHMPHTTYGLMKGIRSHTIINPSVEESTKYGRPNACNLCHLDQSLQWTGEHLTSWYGHPTPQLNDEEKSTSAALRWLLRGDAGQRALAAWHFGWEPARQVSGTEWMPPFLAELFVDPYSVVRYIAHHALKKNDGFQDLQFDFIGDQKTRAAGRRAALERWQPPAIMDADKARRLLLEPDGSLQEEAMRRLIQLRDERPIELWE